jgi:hypothetical protein
MIADVDTDSPREVFFRVAADMFADGNFNWGRVVALFYFASKLVLKVGCCWAVGLLGPGRPGVNFHSPDTTVDCVSAPSFIRPPNTLGLLCAGPILGTSDPALNKAGKVPVLLELRLL